MTERVGRASLVSALCELRQHGDHSFYEDFACFNLAVGRSASDADDVEGSGTLQSGASCDSIEAAAIGDRILPGAFGDVERDRRRCASELIGEGGVSSWNRAYDVYHERDELERAAVHIETFVVEHARLSAKRQQSFAAPKKPSNAARQPTKSYM